MTRLVFLSLAYILCSGASFAAQASQASILVDLEPANQTGCISNARFCGPDNVVVDGEGSNGVIGASIARAIP